MRALRLRDDALVACGLRATGGVPPARAVQAHVEDLLRATRLDALPLALVPLRAAWRAMSPWPELAGTCARLVREGKVLRWGAELAALDDETAELAREPWLCALALPYSACERDAEPVIAAALEQHRAVLARRPLAGGGLAGALGPGAPLAPRDERRALNLEPFAVVAARLAPLVAHEPAAARSSDAARQAREAARRPEHVEAQTLAELALRYALDRGVLALPRLHRAAHVPDALAALTAPPLSPALRARIEDAISPGARTHEV